MCRLRTQKFSVAMCHFVTLQVYHIFMYMLITDGLFVCPQDGYHTYRGGFWNYFSMGKNANNFSSSLVLNNLALHLLSLCVPIS